MNEDDKTEIIHLLDEVFKGWPQFDLEKDQLSHFNWKFFDVVSIPSLISIAKSNGKVVGVSSNVFQRVKIGKDVYLSSKGTEAAVHPKHRRKGVISKTMKLRDETRANLPVDFTWSFTSNPILIKMYHKEGRETFPEHIVQLNRISNVVKHVKKREWKPVIAYLLGVSILKYWHKMVYRKKRDPISSKIVIKTLSFFDDTFNVFWEKVKLDYNFIVERNAEYMKWRYGDSRGGIFLTKVAYFDDEIIGYCVTRINNNDPDYPEGIIVDFLSIKGHENAVNELLDDAIQYFDSLGINNVRTWMVSNHNYVNLFLSRGFIKSRANVFIDLRNLRIGADWQLFKESNRGQLFFQIGDTDSI